MSHFSGEGDPQETETRLQSRIEEILESELESKMEGLMESFASLLQAKLGDVGTRRGESGSASDGVSESGRAAGGAADAASSTGDGGRDAASGNTPTAHGGGPEGAGSATGLQGSGGARGFYPQGEIAAGGSGYGLGGGLSGGLGGHGLAAPGYGRDVFSLPPRITPPHFKGSRNEYLAFREDFLQASKMADIYDQFIGLHVRPVPVGESEKSRSTLLAEGFTAEEITASFHAWQFLSTALQQTCDRDILRRSISPKDALANLDSWYDPQTQGATQNQFERFNQFSISPNDNPLEKLSKLEDLANRLREKGIATDARFVYARFLSALPPDYEHARLTLQSYENLQRSDIVRVISTQHSYVSERYGNKPVSHALTANGIQRGRNGGKKGGRSRKNGGKKEGGGSSESSGSTSGESTESETRRYHRCKHVGHIKPNCTTPESEFLAVCATCDGFGHTSGVCPSKVEETNLAFVLSEEDTALLNRGVAVDVPGF